MHASALASLARPFARPLALLLVLGALGCRSASPAPEPRLYPGFEGYERTVRTGSPEAQRWFDQGIQLLYGFNHDEAVRSFQAATAIDPDCLMAWWGIAYACGVDINNPAMTEDEQRLAYDAAQQALRCAELPGADPVEAALARAVAARYAFPMPADREPLDRAYADAMQAAWELAPGDPDVGTVYADALMNLQPWDYWTRDGQPKGRTQDFVAVLETILGTHPSHPGANHFLIHALEASPEPARAEAAADRLRTLVPGSGHLVHMPSHIFVRVGRYADATDANQEAIAADRAYFEIAPPPGFYSLYFSHNVHMLAFAAMMEARAEVALEAGRTLEREVPESFLKEHTAVADGLMSAPLHVMIRFGRWEEILAYPEAPDYRILSNAMRRYARGVALAALGRPAEARQEQRAFEELAARVPEDWKIGQNDAHDVLALARHMLEGEILYREDARDEAFRVLREGVALEEALIYDEPPGWMQPIRHALGALLLGAGRAAEAETVYREDLVAHPGNGWSLLGLERALAAQGETAEVPALRAQRAQAWARADVQPTSSCYCQPSADPLAAR